MKAYASFGEYLADPPTLNGTVIRKLRNFVRRTAPDFRESVKLGNGCWLKGREPVAYVHAAPDHSHFGVVRDPA